MQLLERVHLVQFFLFEAQSLRLDATSAIIAPNGAGKSALLDALQIVLLGGDRSRIRFNAQAGGSARARSIRDYCLGTWRSGEEGRKRRTATTYISLVFRDTDTGEVLTAGIALGASVDEPDHRLHGLYLLPGVALDPERVLVILVFTDNEVQNRIVHTRRTYTPSELEQTANYLNQHFAGQPLPPISARPPRRWRARALRRCRRATGQARRLIGWKRCVANRRRRGGGSRNWARR